MSKIYFSIELVEEVVSIYNAMFQTPKSRMPYFIKVQRCLSVSLLCDIPVPVSPAKIEIVVPDINNRAKFYKYIVYNHTYCTCGNHQTMPKLHKTSDEGIGKCLIIC